MNKKWPDKNEHCDCHVIADRDLKNAIYWLLRVYRSAPTVPMNGVWGWLVRHGYPPNGPKATRLLARKRVPR
jgi:hypothetical protein